MTPLDYSKPQVLPRLSEAEAPRTEAYSLKAAVLGRTLAARVCELEAYRASLNIRAEALSALGTADRGRADEFASIRLKLGGLEPYLAIVERQGKLEPKVFQDYLWAQIAGA